MPKVRTGTADKWVRRAGSAGQEYAEGVANPREDWADRTAAAEANYENGVRQAMTRKAFGSGVKRAGTQKWQENALAKGPDRFASGVAQGADNYGKAVGPYLEEIERTKLPARKPKGDPANIQRVAVIAAALRRKKEQLTGGK